MSEDETLAALQAGFKAMKSQFQMGPFAWETFVGGVDCGLHLVEERLGIGRTGGILPLPPSCAVSSSPKPAGENPAEPEHLRPDPTPAPPRVVTDMGGYY